MRMVAKLYERQPTEEDTNMVTEILLTAAAMVGGIGGFVVVLRHEINETRNRPTKPWY